MVMLERESSRRWLASRGNLGRLGGTPSPWPSPGARGSVRSAEDGQVREEILGQLGQLGKPRSAGGKARGGIALTPTLSQWEREYEAGSPSLRPSPGGRRSMRSASEDGQLREEILGQLGQLGKPRSGGGKAPGGTALTPTLSQWEREYEGRDKRQPKMPKLLGRSSESWRHEDGTSRGKLRLTAGRLAPRRYL